jgi:hypothetical protein
MLQVVVYSKDVPDLLRLIVNKMEIIERHAYLQEQQHEVCMFCVSHLSMPLAPRPSPLTPHPSHVGTDIHLAVVLYLQELRGSFLRLRAAVADLTYSASYSSGVGSRYGAAPPAPLPYEGEDE